MANFWKSSTYFQTKPKGYCRLREDIEEEINHYQLEVGSMVIWLEAGSQAKATSPTECG